MMSRLSREKTFLTILGVAVIAAIVVAIVVPVALKVKQNQSTAESPPPPPPLPPTGALTASRTANISCPSNISITWKGYDWCVRLSFNSGPGPSDFVPSNVWVDNNNSLHLRITNSSGNWTCAELYTPNRFSFGTFQWQVEGRLDTFDRRIVLGFFTYGPPVAGPDGTNEIDIEFARWGDNRTSAPNLWYTVWPAVANRSKNGSSILFNQTSLYTTHRFTWSAGSITLKALHGFQNDDTNLFFSWQTPVGFASSVPNATAPIHMNLWVNQWNTTSRSPSNDLPVEVIIHDFKYVDPTASTTTSTTTSTAISTTTSTAISTTTNTTTSTAISTTTNITTSTTTNTTVSGIASVVSLETRTISISLFFILLVKSAY